jgi:hypothetical protein
VQVQEDGLKVQKDVPQGGGFYADKAIKTVLYKNFTEMKPTRPIFVLVTDHPGKAIMQDDFDLWQMALPEGDQIYHLDSKGELLAYRMGAFKEQTGEKIKAIEAVPVLAWPSAQSPQAYVSDNGEAAVITAAPDNEKTGKASDTQTSWETAVLQQSGYFQAILHPEMKTKNQFNLVKGSIASGILSPYTAYIVLENEAQENMLKEKQKQILAAKSDFDLGENLSEETVMAEPGLLVVAVLFIGVVLLKKKKEHGREMEG